MIFRCKIRKLLSSFSWIKKKTELLKDVIISLYIFVAEKTFKTNCKVYVWECIHQQPIYMNICLLYFRRIGFQRRYAQYHCYTITINVMFFFNSYQTKNSRIQFSLHSSKESILWFWGSPVQLKFQFSRVMTNQKKRNYALHSYLVTWTHCSVFINVV